MKSNIVAPTQWPPLLAQCTNGARVVIALQAGSGSWRSVVDVRPSVQLIADRMTITATDIASGDGSPIDFANAIHRIAVRAFLDYRRTDTAEPTRTGKYRLTLFDPADNEIGSQRGKFHRRDFVDIDDDDEVETISGDMNDASIKIVHATNKLLADTALRLSDANLKFAALCEESAIKQRNSVIEYSKGAMEVTEKALGIHQKASELQVAAVTNAMAAEQGRSFWESPAGVVMGDKLVGFLDIGAMALMKYLEKKMA